MPKNLIAVLQSHSLKYREELESCHKTIYLLETHGIRAFENENWDGHITASMLIMNHDRTRVLLMFHKKLKMWLQFGGHSDGSEDTFSTAVREFHEESGIDIEPICDGIPFFVDVHDIPPDAKGRPQHNHHDVLYLGFIDDSVPFVRQESEVDDIRWFDIATIHDTLPGEQILDKIDKIQKFLK